MSISNSSTVSTVSAFVAPVAVTAKKITKNNDFNIALVSRIESNVKARNNFLAVKEVAETAELKETARLNARQNDTQAVYHTVLKSLSPQALKFARENSLFNPILDESNAYQVAKIFGLLEAVVHSDCEKFFTRFTKAELGRNVKDAQMYPFFVINCKVRDFKNIPNRVSFLRTCSWTMKDKHATTLDTFLNRDSQHETDTQSMQCVRVLRALGALRTVGKGETGEHVWNMSSPVTIALKALAE